MPSERPGSSVKPAGMGGELRGVGRDGREALSQLLDGLVTTTGDLAPSDSMTEIAVAFRAAGATVGEVAAAAVSAVIEQQETHALHTHRIDLDGWMTTDDGIRIWGFLTGVPDAASPSENRGDVVGTPTVTSGPAGVTFVVALGEIMTR
ncbi:MAG: hypothetical protein H0W06_09625 [Chloroflexia bacterium]|nr:hypothetical protein [Chloroflexia bacterium]